METKVVIELPGHSNFDAIFDSKELKQGSLLYQGDDFKVILKKATSFRLIDSGQLLELAVTWSSGVATGVVANWLYDKLKDKKVNKITINKKEIIISKNEIQASFTEINSQIDN